MVKAFVFYKLSKKKSGKKESLKEYSLVYFQKIVQASPFSGELIREAKIWGVMISSMLFFIEE